MTHRKTTAQKYGGFEIVGTVGDVDFLTYGGGEVYKNADGEYALEYVEPPPDDIELNDKNARWTIYRVELERGLPAWGSYKAAAKTSGQKPSELKNAFESDDPMKRAWAYETFAGHYGWDEFDSYPLVLDKHEVESRYEKEGEEEEEEEEIDFDEGMEDGYIISDKGRGVIVTQANKRVGAYADKDEAIKAINKHMERENFYPNVYYVNDHGNVDLLDENGDIIESRV